MKNKTWFLFFIVALILAFSTTASRAEDDKGSIKVAEDICDGTDPNSGKLLIPEAWIKRCGICNGEGHLLELDKSCIDRLAYDSQIQRDQFSEDTMSVVTDYANAEINAALQNLHQTGVNEEKFQIMAKGSDNKIPDTDGKMTDNPVLTDNNDVKSEFDNCIGNQGDDSGRCYIESHNHLSAEITNVILQNLLMTQAMRNRSQYVKNMFDKIIPETKVNLNNKKLILPNDEIAAEVDKDDRGGADD